jgi:ferredoxin--NADP+ reductase
MNDVSLVQPTAGPALKASGAFFIETVTWVQHWTSSLF